MHTIVFFPEGAYGPTNNCVGIGDVLRRRGHRVVFIIEESFQGALEEKGFEERLMRLTPPAGAGEDPGQFWKDFIRETAPIFRRPTIEQLEGFIAPTFQALIDGAKHVDARLVEIIDELQPNVIVAGYPSGDDSQWSAYREEFARTHSDMHADFDAFCRERGAPALPELEFMHTSPWLNLWIYPREVDYTREGPLGTGWHNLEASVRATDAAWSLPQPLASADGPLVYLSLGSLASGDLELLQGLVDTLADSPYRVIVSKGPQHEQLRLAPNMAGEEFLPQTSILPQVDLVITHGGNNTVTESLYFGKPMVVLPVFWDQYDNAQRIDETGFGVRLDTYGHDPSELPAAIDRLLAGGERAERRTAVSRRLREAPGTVRAADLVAQVAT